MINQEKEQIKEAKIKAARYCAYRERAPLELREKLEGQGLSGASLQQAFDELVQQGFVDEQRFALAFTQGKFRLKKWGKIKIEHHLRHFQISELTVQKALDSLPVDQYLHTLKSLIDQKKRQTKIDDPYVANHKIARYLLSKGFESELVWKELKISDV